jgi:hypothetical protein
MQCSLYQTLVVVASLVSVKGIDLGNRRTACKSFTCSEGHVAVPQRRLKLTSGGCSAMTNSMGGSFGSQGAEMLLETCCDVYQACTGICGMRYKTCEADFLSCMDTTCAKQTSSLQDKCKQDMGLYKVLIQLGDCSKYDSAQKSNCKCVAEDKADRKRKEVLTDFWKKNNKKKKKLPQAADKLLKKHGTSAKKFAKLLLRLVKKYPKAVTIQKNKQQQVMEELIKRTQRDSPSYQPPPPRPPPRKEDTRNRKTEIIEEEEELNENGDENDDDEDVVNLDDQDDQDEEHTEM